jgi:DNA-binding NtrC family response regulator
MAQTILVVDDDPVQRRLLEAAITRSGMQVVTAPGGQPALDLINGPRGEQITLMLLDLVMPDMGGLDVLARLRPANPDLPVIVLTAKGGIDSAVEAMQRRRSNARRRQRFSGQAGQPRTHRGVHPQPAQDRHSVG